jgi:hypothetical protein
MTFQGNLRTGVHLLGRRRRMIFEIPAAFQTCGYAPCLQAIAADVFFLSTFTLHHPNVVVLHSPMRARTVAMPHWQIRN